MADSISSLHRRSFDMCGHWYGNPVLGGFGAGLDSPLQDEKGEVQMVARTIVGVALGFSIGGAILGNISLDTAVIVIALTAISLLLCERGRGAAP